MRDQTAGARQRDPPPSRALGQTSVRSHFGSGAQQTRVMAPADGSQLIPTVSDGGSVRSAVTRTHWRITFFMDDAAQDWRNSYVVRGSTV